MHRKRTTDISSHTRTLCSCQISFVFANRHPGNFIILLYLRFMSIQCDRFYCTNTKSNSLWENAVLDRCDNFSGASCIGFTAQTLRCDASTKRYAVLNAAAAGQAKPYSGRRQTASQRTRPLTASRARQWCGAVVDDTKLAFESRPIRATSNNETTSPPVRRVSLGRLDR